jgi:hypothetical protein
LSLVITRDLRPGPPSRISGSTDHLSAAITSNSANLAVSTAVSPPRVPPSRVLGGALAAKVNKSAAMINDARRERQYLPSWCPPGEALAAP